jgi:hypothetical protein
LHVGEFKLAKITALKTITQYTKTTAANSVLPLHTNYQRMVTVYLIEGKAQPFFNVCPLWGWVPFEAKVKQSL